MKEIVKKIKNTNASYRDIGAGDAKNTDLFLDKENYPFFEGKDVVNIRLHKENFIQAILFISSMLPKKFDSSSTHAEVKFSMNFVHEALAKLEGLFIEDGTPVNSIIVKWQTRYNVEQKNGKTDTRFYLYGLLKEHPYTDLDGSIKINKFTIRDYLLGGYSTVRFTKEDDSDIFDFYIENSNERFTENVTSTSNFATNREIIELLQQKKNLVLTGAPGTGKTYLAKAVAASLITNGTKNQWEELSEDERNRVKFVQFHPSYDYTDFVEGLRPDENGDFKREDGTFKAFCKNAILGKNDSIQSINYEVSDLTSQADFQEIIDSLKDDIKIGAISTYSPTGVLLVNDKNRIEYKREKTKKTILESNVELLYNYYINEGMYDISSVVKVEMEALLEELTKAQREKITRTIDFTEYKWTLSELLRRKREIDEGTYQRAYVSTDTTIDEVQPYVFIIDEINRGELSKIFGELFYSIEPDYRGVTGRVITQYNNMVEKSDVFKEGFYIPKNIYIIGTMNDIDRGVEAMDFAIRRRFAWKEVSAEESAKKMGLSDEVQKVMEELNKALLSQNLTEAHCIGGAYFLKLSEDKNYAKLWDNHLKGIITEYFRGEPDGSEKINEIKAAYDMAVKAQTTNADTGTENSTTES